MTSKPDSLLLSNHSLSQFHTRFCNFVPFSIFLTAAKFNKNDFLWDVSERSLLEPTFHDDPSMIDQNFKTPFIVQSFLPLFLSLLMEKINLPPDRLAFFFRQASLFDPSLSGIFFYRLISFLSYSFLNPNLDTPLDPAMFLSKRCYIADFLSCFSQYSPFFPLRNDSSTDFHPDIHFLFHRDLDFIFIHQTYCSWSTPPFFLSTPPFSFLTKDDHQFLIHRIPALSAIHVEDFFLAESFDLFHSDLDLSKFPPSYDLSHLPILPRRLSRLFFEIFIQLSFFFLDQTSSHSLPFFRPSSFPISNPHHSLFLPFWHSQDLLLEHLSQLLHLLRSIHNRDSYQTYLHSLPSSVRLHTILQIESLFSFLYFFSPFSSSLQQSPLLFDPTQHTYFFLGHSLLHSTS